MKILFSEVTNLVKNSPLYHTKANLKHIKFPNIKLNIEA